MRHVYLSLLALATLGSVASITASVSAQAAGYCPVYADNNWRLSWVEEELHAWTKDQRGSTKFEAHLELYSETILTTRVKSCMTNGRRDTRGS
jgi:hypothetical protein